MSEFVIEKKVETEYRCYWIAPNGRKYRLKNVLYEAKDLKERSKRHGLDPGWHTVPYLVHTGALVQSEDWIGYYRIASMELLDAVIADLESRLKQENTTVHTEIVSP